MADSIKELRAKIQRTQDQISKEVATFEEWNSMVPEIEMMLKTLAEGSPDYGQWKSSLDEAKTQAATHEAALSKLRGELAALQADLPDTPEQAAPKFDREKHPAYQRQAAEKAEPEQLINFSIGDIVEAQWSDRQWYKAKIQSVLGSVSAPKYLVRFLEYNDTLTVDRNALRLDPRKRKHEAEPAAAATSAAPVVPSPHVISGPVSVNPNAQLNKKTTGDEEEPRKKSRIANKKQLKERQSNWQQFQAKTAKKIPKKESMFRTSTEAGSRVGFTGSGKGMSETIQRARHDHKGDAKLDEEYQEAERAAKASQRGHGDSASRDRPRY